MILKEYLDKNYTKEEQRVLTYLRCSKKNITSLKGIENCVNLREIYCSDNNLTSFSCASLEDIKKLDKLTFLVCSYNNLSSLEGIEKLDKLTSLDCHDNKLTSLKGIENLPKLGYLNCDNNPLSYSNMTTFNNIILEVKKEVRQTKIQNLLNS